MQVVPGATQAAPAQHPSPSDPQAWQRSCTQRVPSAVQPPPGQQGSPSAPQPPHELAAQVPPDEHSLPAAVHRPSTQQPPSPHWLPASSVTLMIPGTELFPDVPQVKLVVRQTLPLASLTAIEEVSPFASRFVVVTVPVGSVIAVLVTDPVPDFVVE